MTIHFICRGNANRSMLAEAYLKSLKLKSVKVISSGTVADIYRQQNEAITKNIIKLLSKYGIEPYAKNNPDQLSQNYIELADLNICMNKVVKAEADNLVKLPKNSVVWDIDDTGEGHRQIGPGDDPYKYTEEIYQEIKLKVDNLIEELELTK